MSAYLCSDRHLAYLIRAAAQTNSPAGDCFSYYHDGKRRTVYAEPSPNGMSFAEFGQMLRDENVRSLQARYGDRAAELVGGFTTYTHQIYPDPSKFSAVQVAKALACYAYQTCEHGAWTASAAHSFVRDLEHRQWSRVPGYEAAAWGEPEPGGTISLSDLARGRL